MKVYLQTRCGCFQVRDLAVNQAPAHIQIQLTDNFHLGLTGDLVDNQPTRRFTYVGTQKGTDRPVYVENIDQEGYVVPEPIATIAETNEQPETD